MSGVKFQVFKNKADYAGALRAQHDRVLSERDGERAAALAAIQLEAYRADHIETLLAQSREESARLLGLLRGARGADVIPPYTVPAGDEDLWDAGRALTLAPNGAFDRGALCAWCQSRIPARPGKFFCNGGCASAAARARRARGSVR